MTALEAFVANRPIISLLRGDGKPEAEMIGDRSQWKRGKSISLVAERAGPTGSSTQAILSYGVGDCFAARGSQ